LNIAQVRPEPVVYINGRAMFVQMAQELGIRGIIHHSYETAKKTLERFELSL